MKYNEIQVAYPFGRLTGQRMIRSPLAQRQC